MPFRQLTQQLKDEAHRLGFQLAGVCPAVAPPGISRFREWLAAGYAGEMRYFADRAEAYENPANVLDGARSILMLAVAYRTTEPERPNAGQGRVSRYAWGYDYHDLIRSRLNELAAFHRRMAPQASVRGVVDSAPLLEREFGQLAGLGWIGKNTLLLDRRYGSWFFLAALLTSEVLNYDEPSQMDHCGTCRACLDACPTGALFEPYKMDARRCISYLTIELRGGIRGDLRPLVGEWLFGCDLCQEVCPWNRRSPATAEPALQPAEDMNPIELATLFFLSEAEFRERFRRSPLWRPKRRGLLRNAAIALGNRPHQAATDGLVRGLNDAEPLVRAACAWALGRYAGSAARAALQHRRTIETEVCVLEAIAEALDCLGLASQ